MVWVLAIQVVESVVDDVDSCTCYSCTPHRVEVEYFREHREFTVSTTLLPLSPSSLHWALPTHPFLLQHTTHHPAPVCQAWVPSQRPAWSEAENAALVPRLRSDGDAPFFLYAMIISVMGGHDPLSAGVFAIRLGWAGWSFGARRSRCFRVVCLGASK